MNEPSWTGRLEAIEQRLGSIERAMGLAKAPERVIISPEPDERGYVAPTELMPEPAGVAIEIPVFLKHAEEPHGCWPSLI